MLKCSVVYEAVYLSSFSVSTSVAEGGMVCVQVCQEVDRYVSPEQLSEVGGGDERSCWWLVECSNYYIARCGGDLYC